jgi:hypothetical protein
MRSLRRASLFAALLVIGAQVVQPIEPTIGTVAATTQTLSFRCPEAVNVGVTNRPADWISYDQKRGFKRASIAYDNKGAVITCEYDSDQYLARDVPGYRCQADHPPLRDVTCSPKQKSPSKK